MKITKLCPKGRKALLVIEGNTWISKISRDADITISHTNKIVKGFQENSIVEIKFQGRDNKVTLTEKGRLIQEQLINIDRILGE